MNKRRQFLEKTFTGLTGLTLLPAIDAFATISPADARPLPKEKLKLRFAVASDGHYGQPETDSALFYRHLVQWLEKEHQQNKLDFVILNGDLVHDRPDLLPEVKEKYLA